MNEQILSTLIDGIDSSLSDAARAALERNIRSVTNDLESAKANRTSQSMLGSSGRSKTPIGIGGSMTDAEVYTNLSELINGNTKDVGGFGSLMDSLYAKNKKGYAILKDYELMPILIPQINRVLMFLVNECLSPDIQNDQTFTIKFLGSDDPDRVQDDIDAIKREMKLDNLLREVYTNRYKLGREYYLIVDYNKTFDHMLEMIKRKSMNEAAAGMLDIDYLDQQYAALTAEINEAACDITITRLSDNSNSPTYRGTKLEKEVHDIVESTVHLSFNDMNIKIERSPIAKYVKDAHGELLAEAYSGYRMDNIMLEMACTGAINEAVVDSSKLEQIVTNMRKKKLQRCTIERLDPARVFKLRIGGRTIGYFHITDIVSGTSATVNFAQALKDQLLKSRATNLGAATQSAEEVISKELAQKIINTFDPNIGVNRVEDIDLLHDFIKNNEIYKGNKRITFYYADEIHDISRADDSIMINGVFFTKLYATLLLNNIMTKVLRGRGRQIHTVRMGASPSVKRYLQNAMASLTMPETNLGTLHGSFEQIMNPFNAASDIVIPTEDETDRFITTDYIPGQDVDMNDEFLRSLLNAIVASFGLDSAVIDATNGNLQFARTLTMESLQICNAIRNEQQDAHDPWESLCLQVLKIMGTDATKLAIDQDRIKVQFFEPKSLIIQNTIDDLNNAKSLAEAIADIVPEFNEEGAETKRNKFIYRIVKERTNIDWGMIEDVLKDIQIDVLGDDLEAELRKIITEYKENTKTELYGDTNNDRMVDDQDHVTPEEEQYGEYADMGEETSTEESEELTPEESDLVSSPDDELEGEEEV